jgi:hypothetical protein
MANNRYCNTRLYPAGPVARDEDCCLLANWSWKETSGFGSAQASERSGKSPAPRSGDGTVVSFSNLKTMHR